MIEGKRMLTNATLCIYAADLDPEEITARLRITPTDAFRKGEPISTKRRKYADHPTGGWLLSSRDRVTSAELDAHLSWLLAQVAQASEAIRALVAEGKDLAISCVVSGAATGGGPTLEAATLAKIAELGLPVDLDIYC